MSEISDSAQASVIVADFANVDGGGKLNLIGAGISITTIVPATGQTAAFTVLAITSVDPRFVGQQFALELALFGEDGQVVQPLGSGGPGGSSPVRIAQPISVQAPQPPQGGYVPPGTVRPGANMIVNFQEGLPLASGKHYEWRASIDGNVVATAGLLVAGPPPVTIG